MRRIERILVYTHNSIGLGHAVRTMAVIDGMRTAMPEVDFLVLSGGSAPQIFLSQGVETVKLPGLRHDLDAPGQPYRPRYLRSLDLKQTLAWRQRLIKECLESFRPCAVLVEHSLAGLMGEAVPLLAGGHSTRPGGYVLAHLSRGIYRAEPLLLAPAADYPGLRPGTPATACYDAFYVLEERAMVDVNAEFFGADPALEDRILYLGRIAALNLEELRPGNGLAALGLRPRPLVLVNLGRHGRVVRLHARVFAALRGLGLFDACEVLAILDVYLAPEVKEDIRALPEAAGVRFPPFLPCLAEFMTEARLVVCRAGYNTVNELLLTGARALVIPECHPSQEQERRAAGLPRLHVAVLDEAACFGPDLEPTIAGLLHRPPGEGRYRFDRFAIGGRIAEDISRLISA